MLVCVIGNYGDSKTTVTDGQGVKTIELYNSLVERYGSKEVCKVNLHKKNTFILALLTLIALVRCKNLIVLVSVNGRKVYIPFIVKLNKIFHRRIFHSLIGSTTHKTLNEYPNLIPVFQSLAGNWSETKTEKELLEKCGLNNVEIVKNFKNLSILKEEDIVYKEKIPFSFCTFSRIEELKGIPNIVRAIKKLNSIYGYTVCTLDIYGYVMAHYEEGFEKLKDEFDDCINYRGIVDFKKSVDVLNKYYMVVFPTLYYTEGIPGTIIDAFASGVPVLCSEWESCFDIMNQEVGITYKFGDDNALLDALKFAVENPNLIMSMKKACINEAKKYTKESVLDQIDHFFKECK